MLTGIARSARSGAECTRTMTKSDEPTRSRTTGHTHKRAHAATRTRHDAHTKTRSHDFRNGCEWARCGGRAPHTHAAPSQPQGDSEHSHASFPRRLPRAGGWGHSIVLRRLPRAVGLPPATCRRGTPPATCQHACDAACHVQLACHLPRAGGKRRRPRASKHGGGRYRPRASNA